MYLHLVNYIYVKIVSTVENNIIFNIWYELCLDKFQKEVFIYYDFDVDDGIESPIT